jgi:hypothetical protein
MRVIASIPILVLFVAVARIGWAQELPRLVVERGAGAEPCPDASSLATRIAQIRGSPQRDLATSYRVLFTRKDDTFSAVISTGPHGANVRTLENRGSTCAALGNAAAVTLALLFDSDVAVKSNSEPSLPVVVPSAVSPPPLPEGPKTRRDATLAIGASGLAGVLRPVSPGLTAEAGIAGTRWRMSLGAIWALPQTTALGPGTVQDQLLGGFARTCFAPWRGESLRFDVCSGAVFGLVTAEGQGYTRNESHIRPWVAVPFELSFGGWTVPAGWEVVAGGLASIRRHDFSVDNLGVAYESPPVGAMLSLRAIGMLPW